MKSRVGEDRVAKAKAIDLRLVIPVREAERGSGAYVHGYCPYHEAGEGNHKTKSFLVYADHYVCLSTNCGEAGDIVNWYSFKLYGNPHASLKNGAFRRVLDAILGPENDRLTSLATMDTVNGPTANTPRYRSDLPKIKNDADFAELEALARVCHEELLATPLRLTYFLSRGFTMKTIKQEWWGWDGKRYTITIWEGVPGKSRLLALRYRARSGGEDYSRYSGVRDFNEKLMYNPVALRYASRHNMPIVVMYGEFDARLSWQYRVPTVSPTNGALSFQADWLKGFDGDVVFVPDRGEEKAAFKDASKIGTNAWVVQYPEGPFKDFSELCTVEGSPYSLWKRVYLETRIRFFKEAMLWSNLIRGSTAYGQI